MRELVCLLGVLAGLIGASTVAHADESSRYSLNGMIIGVRGPTDLGLGLLEARFAVTSHLRLTAAPTLVVAEGGDTEHQLRTAATLLLDVGTLRIDDRNMWVFSDAGTTRYRNRIRLTQPAKIDGQVIRLQILNEAFYEKGGRGWFRNLAGVGAGVDVGRSVSFDAYWLQQDDDGRRPSSLFVLMLTAHLQ